MRYFQLLTLTPALLMACSGNPSTSDLSGADTVTPADVTITDSAVPDGTIDVRLDAFEDVAQVPDVDELPGADSGMGDNGTTDTILDADDNTATDVPEDNGVTDTVPPEDVDNDTAGPAGACLNESDQALLAGGDDAVKQQATDCAMHMYQRIR